MAEIQVHYKRFECAAYSPLEQTRSCIRKLDEPFGMSDLPNLHNEPFVFCVGEDSLYRLGSGM